MVSEKQIQTQTARIFEEEIPEIDQSSSVVEFRRTARREISAAESTVDMLWEARSRLKAIAAQMGVSYLEQNVRLQLYKQIDQLFDIEEDISFIASDDSFMTLMRIIINFQPKTAPFLNISDTGNFVATWLDDSNKIRVECFKNDATHWFINNEIQNKSERAAGESCRLVSLLRQVEPFIEKGWFNPYGER